MDREILRKKELLALSELYAKDSGLFQVPTWIDDDQYLANIGISIPRRHGLLAAYLRFWPQDFIVEEVGIDGGICTIARENVMPPTFQIAAETRTIYATLVKCNLSTFEAAEDLARQLGCKIQQIGYAGLKDKNAITSQRISLRDIRADALKNVSSKNYFLKDVAEGKGVMERGQLRGNRFTILLRTPEPLADDQALALWVRVNELAHDGFYNFFYAQRFGTPRCMSASWGEMLLAGKHADTIGDFMTNPGLRELGYWRLLRDQARELGNSWPDVRKLFQPFALHFVHELAVLEKLQENDRNLISALRAIPEQVDMWIKATTSLYFNKLVSLYVQLGRPLPAEVPLPVSFDEATWDLYKFVLDRNTWDTWQKSLSGPFPVTRARNVPRVATKDSVELDACDVIEEGILLRFTLGSGQYATTFLSHLCQLAGGTPFTDMDRTILDTPAIVGDASAQESFNYFDPIIEAKDKDRFGPLLAEN